MIETLRARRAVACRLVLALTFAAGLGGHVVRAQPAAVASPPPFPGRGDLDARAGRLLDAIERDEPSAVADLFLAREAFRRIKAVDAPDPLFDRLFRAFERDVHALHARVPRGARFRRFELSRRRGWVVPGEEANRLPYWAQRHTWLVYEAGGVEGRVEVRTMIWWDGHWCITHLSEFH